MGAKISKKRTVAPDVTSSNPNVVVGNHTSNIIVGPSRNDAVNVLSGIELTSPAKTEAGQVMSLSNVSATQQEDHVAQLEVGVSNLDGESCKSKGLEVSIDSSVAKNSFNRPHYEAKIASLEQEISRLTILLDISHNSLKEIESQNLQKTADEESKTDLYRGEFFSEEMDEKETIQILFNEFSGGKDFLSLDSLLAAKADEDFIVNHLNMPTVEWTCFLNDLEAQLKNRKPTSALNIEHFLSWVREHVPSVPGRISWTHTIGLANELARQLNPGTIFDGQQGIKEMDADQIIAACQRFAAEVPALVLSTWQALRDNRPPPAEEANSKFAMTEGAFAGRFATLDDFYGGVEYKLGQPNPKLWEAMTKEHCVRANASSMFLAPNYGIYTKPLWEWAWADDPDHPDFEEGLRNRQPLLGLDDQPLFPGESEDALTETVLHFSLRMTVPGNGEALPAEEEEASNQRERQNADGRGRKASSRSALQVESTASRIPPWAARAAIALRGLPEAMGKATGFLESPEQLARGLMVMQAPVANSTSVAMSIVLPCGLEAAQGKLEQVAQVVLDVCQAAGVQGVGFTMDSVCERRWIYCDHCTETSLQKAVSGLSPSEVRSYVKSLRPPFSKDDLLDSQLTEEDIMQKFRKQTEAWTLEHNSRRQGRRREGGIMKIMCLKKVSGMVDKANLRKEECMALRLYTGPLYVLYNALMRDFPLNVVESLAGNKYETTIFVIVSGITKISKHTPVPPRRLLYRGLGGMLLPEQFWKNTQQGFLGGVELGLMSTTADRNVAIQYSGLEHQRPTVLEIQAGRIDIGASLEFISQYAGESEFLMQPLSCLEVMGRPRIDKTNRGDVLVVPLRVNVNLKSVTVEELEGRRKILHIAMAKNLREELSHEAAEKNDLFAVRMEQQTNGVMRVLKGSSLTAVDDAIHRFDEMTVIGAEYALYPRGKGYFEVELVSLTGQNYVLCVGMVGSNFVDIPIHVENDPLMVGRNENTFSVLMLSDGDVEMCCRLNGYDESDGMPTNWGGNWQPGDVVGVAFDLDLGSLHISVNGDFGPPFGEAFTNIMRPGLVVGSGLYPVIAGVEVDIRYNLGGDPSRPMRFSPPNSDWEASALGPRGARPELTALGLASEQLVQTFQTVLALHEEKPAANFNEDLIYKGLVNEVLDLKVRLLAKQKAIIDMANEGAGVSQMQECSKASFEEFNGFALEQECPYRWRDIFADFFRFKSVIEIPLNIAPCQIAIIWQAVFGTADFREGSQPGIRVKLGSEIIELSQLTLELCLVDRRLQYAKYGAAVAGLVIMNNRLTVVDLAGNDFGELVSRRLVEAVSELENIACINGLDISDEDPQVKNEMKRAIASGCCLSIASCQDVFFQGGDESKNLNDCVGFKSPDQHRGSLGGALKLPSWAFVLARLREMDYKTLILKDNDIPSEVGRIFAWGLRFLWNLRSLDLSENSFGPEGATAISASLTCLTSLTALDLRSCGLSTSGWKVVLPTLESCPLQTLNGLPIDWYKNSERTGLEVLSLSPKDDDGIPKDSGANAFGDDGVEIFCLQFIEHNPGLRVLDLGGCVLGTTAGLSSLAKRLPALKMLRELRLGFCSCTDARGSWITALMSGLSHLCNLEVLEMSTMSLWDQGATQVGASLPALTSLKELYLQYNFLFESGATAIASGLSGLQMLEIMDLDGNRMGNKGCVEVAVAVSSLSVLRTLDLQRNDVPAEDHESLRQKLSHLQGLDLVLDDGLLEFT